MNKSIKKFKCLYCDYETNKEANLKIHNKRLHDLEKLVKFEELDFTSFLNNFNWSSLTRETIIHYSRELFEEIKKESIKHKMIYRLFKPKNANSLVEVLTFLTCKLKFCTIKIAKEFDFTFTTTNKQLLNLIRDLGFLKAEQDAPSKMIERSLSILKNTMLNYKIGDKEIWEGYINLVMEQITKLSSNILELIHLEKIINRIVKRGMIWGILYYIFTKIRYKRIKLYFIQESSKINPTTLMRYRQEVEKKLKATLREKQMTLGEYFNFDKYYVEYE